MLQPEIWLTQVLRRGSSLWVWLTLIELLQGQSFCAHWMHPSLCSRCLTRFQYYTAVSRLEHHRRHPAVTFDRRYARSVGQSMHGKTSGSQFRTACSGAGLCRSRDWSCRNRGTAQLASCSGIMSYTPPSSWTFFADAHQLALRPGNNCVNDQTMIVDALISSH